MKAIVNSKAGTLEMRETPLPEPKSKEIRIKTKACGICATDFEMINGCARSRYPQILGHEWCGIVDKAGDAADKTLEGKLCVGENVLGDGGEVGFEHPGGYAECFLTETDKLQFLPENFSIEEAALIEPLAVSVRALKRLRLNTKSNALIFGDGPIGLIMLMILKKEGVNNIGLVGGRKNRLDLAQQLGASFCVNYHEEGEQLLEKIRKSGKEKHFFNLIEASGSGKVMDILFELASPSAHILLLGDYGKQLAHLKLEDVIHKELEIIGSNASSDAWADAVKLAISGSLPLNKLVTHSFPVGDFEKALNVASKRDFNAIKVLLKW